jgi:hypothetical protein
LSFRSAAEESAVAVEFAAASFSSKSIKTIVISTEAAHGPM